MKRNVCGLERAARIGVGAILLAAAFLPRWTRDDDTVSPGQVLATYAGADLLVTGAIQWCPTNYLLGIDTCREDWPDAVRSAFDRESVAVPIE